MDNSIVQDYLRKNREKLCHYVLDHEKLFELEKEYAPDDYNLYQANKSGYSETETKDGKAYYYKNRKIYPDISDDELDQLLAIVKEKEETKARIEAKNEKKPLAFTIHSASSSADNFAVSFMQGLALITWIGGLILSILGARVEVLKPWGGSDIEFHWVLFFSSAILYFIAGAVCLCLSEVFGNVQSIASAVSQYSVEEQK